MLFLVAAIVIGLAIFYLARSLIAPIAIIILIAVIYGWMFGTAHPETRPAIPEAIWGCTDPNVTLRFTAAIRSAEQNPSAPVDFGLIREATAAGCIPVPRERLTGSLVGTIGHCKDDALDEVFLPERAYPTNFLWFRFTDFMAATGGTPVGWAC